MTNAGAPSDNPAPGSLAPRDTQGAAEAAALFAATFDGATPTVIASAAGRVNLIGEHVDYNGGQVLPMAIERRTTIAIRRASGDASTVASGTQRARGRFDAVHAEKSGNWWDYMAGVARALGDDGIAVPQFDAVVVSDVPTGAGLSSSAALEVSTASALVALAGASLDATGCARAGWRAEREFVGVPCGIMDQFASALGAAGNALHIWCDTERTELVPFRETVLIFDTAVKRSLRGSAFEVRQRECAEAFRLLKERYPELEVLADATPEQVRDAGLPGVLEKRALHVTEETRRVGQVVDALRAGRPIPGELLYASHESLRDLYECSSPELDWFVEHASEIGGVHGARLTGAGWGGCAIAIGTREALERAVQELPPAYEKRFELKPRTWLTQAADGTRVDQGARGQRAS